MDWVNRFNTLRAWRGLHDLKTPVPKPKLKREAGRTDGNGDGGPIRLVMGGCALAAWLDLRDDGNPTLRASVLHERYGRQVAGEAEDWLNAGLSVLSASSQTDEKPGGI